MACSAPASVRIAFHAPRPLRARRAARHGSRWLAVLLALCTTFPAHAWGALGHRLVARLAEDGLGPQARAGIARLLHDEPAPTLAGIATWADELRSSDPGLGRRSARWHYVNLGESGCRYEAARDCPRGDCVVGALDRQLAILADPTRSDADRRQALNFVVHFAGDAHQPLHAGYGHDRGGNRYQLNHHGTGTNLHALWDSGLLNSQPLDEDAWLERLRALPAPAPEALSSPLPAQVARPWAETACAVALAPGVYPQGHVIDDAYVQAHLPQVENQLRLAGTRLANLLNAVFDGHG